MLWLPITSYRYIFFTKPTNTLSRTFITFAPPVFSCFPAHFKRQRLHRLRFVASESLFYAVLLEKSLVHITKCLFHAVDIVSFSCRVMESYTISIKQPASTSQYVAHKQVKVDYILQFAIENCNREIDSVQLSIRQISIHAKREITIQVCILNRYAAFLSGFINIFLQICL